MKTVFPLLLLCAAGSAQGPGGFPPVDPPPGNPITANKAMLGKALFWDEQLSSTGTMACGTCHIPRSGGIDPRAQGAVHPGPDGRVGTPDDIHGSPGVIEQLADGSYTGGGTFHVDVQVTGRKSMSVINSTFARNLFWDGRAGQVFTDPITGQVILGRRAALESQAKGPPTSSVEMGHSSANWTEISQRVARVAPLALASSIPAALDQWIGTRSYPQLFLDAFGTAQVTPARISMAIATYERTLISDQSRFDDFLRGVPNALTRQEAQGERVFRGPGRCVLCHGGPLMTNNQFFNTGVRPIAEDRGRGAITNQAADMGAFKTPSLRNTGLSAPYFHNGAARTLEEVVEFYDRGGNFRQGQTRRIVRLGLSPGEKQALVAFLRSALTDPRVAQGLPPFDRPTLYTESGRAPANYGVGLAGSGGVTPRITAIEPPVLDNDNFTVCVSDGLGDAPAIVLLDLAPGTGQQTIAGVPLYLAGSSALTALPLGSLKGQGSGQGFLSVSFPLPSAPALHGRSVYMQAAVADPAAQQGIASTGGLHVTFFQPR